MFRKAREPRLYTANMMARHLGVTLRWLRAEAEAGGIPCVRAEERLLFDPAAVERVLLERASGDRALQDRAGEDVFVSPRRAAQVLGIPEQLLRYQAVNGVIPCLRDGGRINGDEHDVSGRNVDRDSRLIMFTGVLVVRRGIGVECGGRE